MSSVLYPKFKESALSQNPSVDIDTDIIKVALVNVATDYTYSAAHQYLSDVTRYSGTTDQTLINKTITLGVFDADDVTFSTVAIDGVKTVAALIIYKSTGVAGSSPLIAYIDTGTGFPLTPNGGDIQIAWSAGASKIFAL